MQAAFSWRLDSSIGVVLESLTGRIPKISTVLAGKTPGILMNFFRQKGPAQKLPDKIFVSFATFRGKKPRERTLHSARGSGARGEASL